MNKRQYKKQCTKITKRIDVFNKLTWYHSRRCGKTLLMKTLMNICYTKKYRPFKLLKKKLEDIRKEDNWYKILDTMKEIKHCFYAMRKEKIMKKAIKCPRCKNQIAWQVSNTGNKYNDYIACNPDGIGEYELDENESLCKECGTLYCSNCETELERKYDEYRYDMDLLDFVCEKCLKKKEVEIGHLGQLVIKNRSYWA
jgi:hypothetical protein